MHFSVLVFAKEKLDDKGLEDALAPWGDSKEWDWWQLGGRYTGRLAPAYDPQKDPANWEKCTLCKGTGTRRDGVIPISEGNCNGCSHYLEVTGKPGVAVKWPTQWVKVPNLDIQKVADVKNLFLVDDPEKLPGFAYVDTVDETWLSREERHPFADSLRLLKKLTYEQNAETGCFQDNPYFADVAKALVKKYKNGYVHVVDCHN